MDKSIVEKGKAMSKKKIAINVEAFVTPEPAAVPEVVKVLDPYEMLVKQGQMLMGDLSPIQAKIDELKKRIDERNAAFVELQGLKDLKALRIRMVDHFRVDNPEVVALIAAADAIKAALAPRNSAGVVRELPAMHPWRAELRKILEEISAKEADYFGLIRTQILEQTTVCENSGAMAFLKEFNDVN